MNGPFFIFSHTFPHSLRASATTDCYSKVVRHRGGGDGLRQQHEKLTKV